MVRVGRRCWGMYVVGRLLGLFSSGFARSFRLGVLVPHFFLPGAHGLRRCSRPDSGPSLLPDYTDDESPPCIAECPSTRGSEDVRGLLCSCFFISPKVFVHGEQLPWFPPGFPRRLRLASSTSRNRGSKNDSAVSLDVVFSPLLDSSVTFRRSPIGSLFLPSILVLLSTLPTPIFPA